MGWNIECVFDGVNNKQSTTDRSDTGPAAAAAVQLGAPATITRRQIKALLVSLEVRRASRLFGGRTEADACIECLCSRAKNATDGGDITLGLLIIATDDGVADSASSGHAF